MSDSAPINVTIQLNPEEDAALHDALVDLGTDDRADRVMQWARLGHLVMSMARVAPGKEAMREYFADFTHQTDTLRATIEDHIRLFQKKTVKSDGDLGERYVRERLYDVFGARGDTFEIWSGRGHQGDLLGQIAVPNRPPHRLLIEVKDYSKDVPSHEVDKFRHDLRENPDVKAGLFVSLNTPIGTKKGMINIEVEDGRPAFYVAQDSPGQQLFILAWEVLRMMLDTETRPAAPVLADLATLAAARIRAEVTAFTETTSTHVSRIESIRRQATDIIKAAGTINDESARLEADIAMQAKTLGRVLAAEAQTLASGTKAPPVPIPWSESEWLEGFQERNSKAKDHENNLKALHRWLCGVDGVSGEWTDKGIAISAKGTQRFTIVLLAGGLRFLFPEELVERLGLEAAWEKDKIGQIKFIPKKLEVTLDPDLILTALRG